MVIGDRKNRTDRVKSLRIGDVCKDPPRLAASKGTKLMKLCGGRGRAVAMGMAFLQPNTLKTCTSDAGRQPALSSREASLAVATHDTA